MPFSCWFRRIQSMQNGPRPSLHGDETPPWLKPMLLPPPQDTACPLSPTRYRELSVSGVPLQVRSVQSRSYMHFQASVKHVRKGWFCSYMRCIRHGMTSAPARGRDGTWKHSMMAELRITSSACGIMCMANQLHLPPHFYPPSVMHVVPRHL